MNTQVPSEGLASVEQALVDHVIRGERLNLAAKREVIGEAAMRSWGESRSCRASVIRDILRGRLAADPDPHGLRLRGVRITGRLDLDNLKTEVHVELEGCLLEEGISARGAHLANVILTRCQLEHRAEPPLDAAGLVCSGLSLSRARIIGHARFCAVRLDDAHIGSTLDCTGAALRNDSGPAVRADGLRVSGNMLLRDGFTASGVGEVGLVRLVGAHIGNNLECDGARLHNDSGPAFIGDGLQVGGNMFLRGGFTATGAGKLGAVRLTGAHIGSNLECDGARLRNDSGPALHADRLRVGWGMFLRSGFTATGAGDLGAVRLVGAHIGQLECTDVSLRDDSGSALDADSMQVRQNMFLSGRFTGGGVGAAVDLTGAGVGRALGIVSARLEHAIDSHSKLTAEGPIYARVPVTISAGYWLDLLRTGTPSHAAQPYQQLASGYRALGDDREARVILMAQRDDQLARTHPHWSERLWGRITKVTLGYGYQPWRALLFLAGVVALSCLLAVVLGSHGALAQTSKTAAPGRPCTAVQQVSVGLDLNLPVGTSVARTACDLTKDPHSMTADWLTSAGWVLRLLAWVFAALFIAGFTSAVRKA